MGTASEWHFRASKAFRRRHGFICETICPQPSAKSRSRRRQSPPQCNLKAEPSTMRPPPQLTSIISIDTERPPGARSSPGGNVRVRQIIFCPTRPRTRESTASRIKVSNVSWSEIDSRISFMARWVPSAQNRFHKRRKRPIVLLLQHRLVHVHAFGSRERRADYDAPLAKCGGPSGSYLVSTAPNGMKDECS